MSERKNIERLFQEKLKDFEATPSSYIWENIAVELEKKENKKRVIPFWFNMKAAGIAAALVLGFFTANNYTSLFTFDQSKIDSKIVVSTEKNQKESSKNKNETLQKNQILNTNNPIVESSKSKNLTTNEVLEKSIISDKNNSVVSNSKNENSIVNKNENKIISTNNNQKNNVVSTQNNSIVVNKNKNSKVTTSKNNAIFETKKSSTTALVSAESKEGNTNKSSYFIKKKKINQKIKSNILDNTIETEIVDNTKNKSSKKPVSNKNKTFITNKSSEVLVQNNNNINKSSYFIKKKKISQKIKSNILDNTIETEIVDNTENKSSKKSVSNKNKPFITNKSSEVLVQNNNNAKVNSSNNSDDNIKEKITNATSVNPNYSIANTTIANTILPEGITKDSTIAAVAVVEENPLEKILKDKENENKEEKKIAENTQKWKVKPNVAPLFMSATQGSPIDNQFADNTKSYENSLSVGLGVDYAVSKKLSIRTGINKFDYSYNTNDIVYYADFASKNANSVSKLKTINVASDAKNMIIEDKKVSKSQEIALQTKDDGLLNQKTGYIEVPVEVSYKLLDKKFGIQVITGFSSLFLNENKVSVISSGLTTVVGEANNLNKLHFSTNIGLGFKYSFWKSFEANFEPTFKYQLNTYNANSGGFKPYLIGLYSGISFKF
ncbi:hypothetical protein [Flavobacterium sp.]|uniref:hypothetical protein n=1 Tax=Flavobacterium sp. TaxID=239 RepID=UPI00375107BF